MKNLALLALLVGCAKTASTDLLTHGMYAGITARATGTGTTTVTATLYVGDPINLNFVELTGDDQLVASHAGQDKVMNQVELLNIVSHQAVFQGDTAGGEYLVDFQRTVDPGAPNSVATLPPAFTLAAPPATTSRAAGLTLTWSPATSDTMSWSALGDCIDPASGSITPGTATLTIPGGTFKKKVGQQIADNCAVKLDVTRSTVGTLDPHYGKGGSVSGEQLREIGFTSTP